MKKTVIFILACGFVATIHAQSMEDMEKEYANFVESEQESYSDFVKKENEAFKEFLKQEWLQFKEMQGIPAPMKPFPVKPVEYKKPDQPAPVTQIPVAKPTDVKPIVNSKPVVKPDDKQPLPPIVNKQPTPPIKPDAEKEPETVQKEPVKQPQPAPVMSGKFVTFDFYGTEESIPYTSAMKFKLGGTAEKYVSDVWGKLADSDYMPTIDALKKSKTDNMLNDWAYYLLTKHFAESFTNGMETDESVTLQMFLLAQSGYRAKIARKNNQLILLLGTKQLIYQRSFLTLNDVKYYVLTDRKSEGNSLSTYKSDFSVAKNVVDMDIESPMKSPVEQTKKSRTSRMDISTQTVVNKRLMDFYKDYPQCDFKVYMRAPMSRELQKSLLPTLKKSIAGKSQKDAANLLINYVQTAFDYKTDGEQFGYEKPFFVDELFYYPYSDCEDRSILFSYLVRELMGMDVVLLDYPNHIATAVRFTENIDGDFLQHKGKKYIICDPTYIGASIGVCMPKFKNTPANVIER